MGYEKCLEDEAYLKSMETMRKDWGSDEWSNSSPEADPATYRNEDGVMLTHPIHRMYSMTERSLGEFRTKNDLAVIRHYCLNENAPDHKNPQDIPTGYFVADVERAGPYSMMVEARAVALGDPNYLGYLASNSFNHGFPEVARRFYANYLSLPALPSRIVRGATDDAEVVVRTIENATTPGRGVWYSVVNLGYRAKEVAVELAAEGTVTHTPTATRLGSAPGTVRLALDPFELVALRIR
jgi:hypothetical protein